MCTVRMHLHTYSHHAVLQPAPAHAQMTELLGTHAVRQQHGPGHAACTCCSPCRPPCDLYERTSPPPSPPPPTHQGQGYAQSTATATDTRVPARIAHMQGPSPAASSAPSMIELRQAQRPQPQPVIYDASRARPAQAATALGSALSRPQHAKHTRSPLSTAAGMGAVATAAAAAAESEPRAKVPAVGPGRGRAVAVPAKRGPAEAMQQGGYVSRAPAPGSSRVPALAHTVQGGASAADPASAYGQPAAVPSCGAAAAPECVVPAVGTSSTLFGPSQQGQQVQEANASRQWLQLAQSGKGTAPSAAADDSPTHAKYTSGVLSLFLGDPYL